MTEAERFASAIVVSLAIHWLLLVLPNTEAENKIVLSDDTFVFDLTGEGLDGEISLASRMVFEQIEAPPQTITDGKTATEALAERRREALVRYVDQVSETAHLHRRVSGEGRKLVGNAIVHIESDSKGKFSTVALIRSSGDPELDEDAVQALRATSGLVPRPRILGDAPLSLSLAIKYQFGL